MHLRKGLASFAEMQSVYSTISADWVVALMRIHNLFFFFLSFIYLSIYLFLFIFLFFEGRGGMYGNDSKYSLVLTEYAACIIYIPSPSTPPLKKGVS